MRRYIIRLLGSAFSVFTGIFVGARADAPGVPWDGGMVHTNGNNKYKINIVIGNPWYVGWQSRNPGTHSSEYDAKWSEIFTDHIIGYHKQGHVKWGLMSGKSSATYTGTLISPRTFSVGQGAAATGTRFGDADGKQLWLNHTAGMYSLYYTQTATPFMQARCCEYSGSAKGNSLAFNYSGNGESPSVCPCYYMKANTTYSGDVSCEDDITCSGTSYDGLANNTFYPAVIHDVYFCYQYTGCTSESYPSFDDMAANSPATGFCYLVRNPLIGNKGVIDSGGDTVNDIEKDIDDDGFFDPVLDYTFSCEWSNDGLLYYSCPSGGTYGGYLGNGPYGCYACPSVYGTKVGNYTLTNTTVGVVDGVNGIGACRFSQPISSDDTGQFELTSSAGTAQTCSGTN